MNSVAELGSTDFNFKKCNYKVTKGVVIKTFIFMCICVLKTILGGYFRKGNPNIFGRIPGRAI